MPLPILSVYLFLLRNGTTFQCHTKYKASYRYTQQLLNSLAATYYGTQVSVGANQAHLNTNHDDHKCTLSSSVLSAQCRVFMRIRPSSDEETAFPREARQETAVCGLRTREKRAPYHCGVETITRARQL